MSTEQDWEEFRSAIRITREIMAQPALDDYRGEEISQVNIFKVMKSLILLLENVLKQHFILVARVKWERMKWQLSMEKVEYTA